MIKIIIKEAILKEELQYPEDVFEQIKKISDEAFKTKTTNKQVEIKASYENVLGLNSSVIKNGLVYFSVLNGLGYQTMPDKILSMWNKKSNTFDDQFIERIKKQTFELRVTITDEGEKAHVGLSVKSQGDKKITKMSVILNNNLLNSFGKLQRDQAIRHELRHIFSQLIPNMCKEYGVLLNKTKDPKSVQKIPYFRDVGDYIGIGKDPKKVKAPSPEEADQQGLTTSQAISKYLISDNEFEVWMSDLVHFFIDWLEKNKFLSKKIVDSSTPEDIAIKYASRLIKDIDFRKKFSRSHQEYAIYFRFINDVLKARPQEFPSKLVRYLTKNIKQKY